MMTESITPITDEELAHIRKWTFRNKFVRPSDVQRLFLEIDRLNAEVARLTAI